MQITGYNHVAIPVRNLHRSRHFYETVLGLEELDRPTASLPGAWFKVGGAQLHLAAVEHVTRNDTSIPHVAFTVSRESFQSVIQALRTAETVEVAAPRCKTTSGEPVWSALYRDPDGNVLEITDATT